MGQAPIFPCAVKRVSDKLYRGGRGRGPCPSTAGGGSIRERSIRGELALVAAQSQEAAQLEKRFLRGVLAASLSLPSRLGGSIRETLN